MKPRPQSVSLNQRTDGFRGDVSGETRQSGETHVEVELDNREGTREDEPGDGV